MAVEIIMPRLGWTMEKGVLTEWLKRDGDTIQPGDLLFTVESDKALQEVETFESGILRIPPDSPSVGTMVAVGTVIGYIAAPGETLSFEDPTALATDRKTGTISEPAISSSKILSHAPLSRDFLPSISPRAFRIAGELGVDWTILQGSGRTKRIRERDVRAAAATSHDATGTVVITPVAKRLAQRLGVDIAALAAQNPGKRITRADVERVANATPAVIPILAPVNDPAQASNTRQPLSPTRLIIAERLSAGAHLTAPVTLTTKVNATELVRLREQLRADAPLTHAPIPSFNDIFAKIVAHALGEHPVMNAHLEDHDIVFQDAVHIGIAVDSEHGLLVPVLREVQAKSLWQIAVESQQLIQRVRGGNASADDLSGGTFTITNLGMYDIDAFTPIINVPQTAILGLGAITRTPIFDSGSDKVGVASMMTLSLTFDHRLTDGAPAARFLQRIKQLVERPYIWLIRW